MTSSRVKDSLRTAGLALTVVLAATAAGAAGPTPLHNDSDSVSSQTLSAPQVEPAPPPGATSDSAPASETSVAAGLQTVGSRPGANEASVQVGTLGAPDTASMGLMGSADSLPVTMWSGTTLSDAAKLLQAGPRPVTSRALQNLGHKVLLSQAEPPRGEATGPSFMTLRLRRLLELGDIDAVLQLTSNIPTSAKTTGEQMVRADALLIRGTEDEACSLANNMRRFASDPYWVKLGTYCAVRAGQTESAELSVNLLRMNGVDDPMFYSLYERLAVPKGDSQAAPPPAEAPDLIHAMARAAGVETMDPAKFTNRPAYLSVVAQSNDGKVEPRLAAALAAAKIGALPPEALQPLFAQQSFDDNQLNYPDSAANSVSAALAPALFYQSVQAAASPEPRLTRVLQSYRGARTRGIGQLMATLLVPAVEPIVASPDFVNSGADIVELYLAANAPTPAYDWFAILDTRRDVPGLDKARYDHLSNLLRLAASNEKLPTTPKDLNKLVSRAKKQGTDALAQRAFEINLLVALGAQVDEDVWKDIPSLAPASDGLMAPKLIAFQSATSSGHVAEACLLAIDVLGKGGPAGAPQATVVTIVRGLKTLGLDADARAIAVEAAMGAPVGGA